MKIELTSHAPQQTTLVLSLGAILVLAATLRMAALGLPSFDVDEYLHVLPAQRVLEGEGPRLPSGEVYRRATPYTLLVAASFRLFGVSEVSARAPSALFGMLTVLLTYLVGRRWFGPWPALVASALVAGSPMLVASSRMCRMYSLFHLLYLGFVAAYDLAWERSGLSRWRRLMWSVVMLLVLLGAFQMQTLVLDALAGLAVYWVGMSLFRWRSRHSVFGLLTAVALLAAMLSGLLDVQGVWERVNGVPSWAAHSRYAYPYYADYWMERYPILWWLSPFAAGYAWFTYGRLGFYLLCQFAVPFLLHSFIFDWKSPHYVFGLFPLFALLIAPWLVQAVRTLAPVCRRELEAMVGSRPRWQQALTRLATALLVSVALWGLCVPWFARTLALQRDDAAPQWRAGYAYLAKQLGPGDLLVTTEALGAEYYLRRPATHVLNNFAVVDFQPRNVRSTDGWWIDWYSGLPMVSTLEEFQQLYETHPRGWVLVRGDWWPQAQAVPPRLRQFIEWTCEEIPVVSDRTVRLFAWDRRQLALDAQREASR